MVGVNVRAYCDMYGGKGIQRGKRRLLQLIGTSESTHENRGSVGGENMVTRKNEGDL